MKIGTTVMKRPAPGFTIIELLIGVTVLAIVLALVGPSMRDLLTRQRLRGINAELVSDVQFARAEAVRRAYPVHIRFGSNAEMTCYVLYVPGLTSTVPGGCDCTRRPTQACGGDFEEVKTVQIPRSLQVTVSKSSADDNFRFDWKAGGTSTTAFAIELASPTAGALRTMLKPSGRPAVCSPDGSVPQVQRCAD